MTSSSASSSVVLVGVLLLILVVASEAALPCHVIGRYLRKTRTKRDTCTLTTVTHVMSLEACHIEPVAEYPAPTVASLRFIKVKSWSLTRGGLHRKDKKIESMCCGYEQGATGDNKYKYLCQLHTDVDFDKYEILEINGPKGHREKEMSVALAQARKVMEKRAKSVSWEKLEVNPTCQNYLDTITAPKKGETSTQFSERIEKLILFIHQKMIAKAETLLMLSGENLFRKTLTRLSVRLLGLFGMSSTELKNYYIIAWGSDPMQRETVESELDLILERMNLLAEYYTILEVKKQNDLKLHLLRKEKATLTKRPNPPKTKTHHGGRRRGNKRHRKRLVPPLPTAKPGPASVPALPHLGTLPAFSDLARDRILSNKDEYEKYDADVDAITAIKRDQVSNEVSYYNFLKKLNALDATKAAEAKKFIYGEGVPIHSYADFPHKPNNKVSCASIDYYMSFEDEGFRLHNERNAKVASFVKGAFELASGAASVSPAGGEAASAAVKILGKFITGILDRNNQFKKLRRELRSSYIASYKSQLYQGDKNIYVPDGECVRQTVHFVKLMKWFLFASSKRLNSLSEAMQPCVENRKGEKMDKYVPLLEVLGRTIETNFKTQGFTQPVTFGEVILGAWEQAGALGDGLGKFRKELQTDKENKEMNDKLDEIQSRLPELPSTTTTPTISE